MGGERLDLHVGGGDLADTLDVRLQAGVLGHRVQHPHPGDTLEDHAVVPRGQADHLEDARDRPEVVNLLK